jgi:hypothetical protein
MEYNRLSIVYNNVKTFSGQSFLNTCLSDVKITTTLKGHVAHKFFEFMQGFKKVSRVSDGTQ